MVLGALLASRPSAPGGIALGLDLPLLAVAWIQRDGPGATCRHTATASGCDRHLNPLPWLVAGVVFVAAGLFGLLRLSRSAS